MNDTATSLDRMRDIAMPLEVGWWPPAMGWWVITLLLCIAAGIHLHRRWQAWHANAYRRTALKELAGAETVAQVAAVLKRTALVAFPRQQVASLSGAQWVSYLQDTGAPLPDRLRQGFADAIYGSHASANSPVAGEAELLESAKSYGTQWICKHKVEEQGGGPKPDTAVRATPILATAEPDTPVQGQNGTKVTPTGSTEGRT